MFMHSFEILCIFPLDCCFAKRFIYFSIGNITLKRESSERERDSLSSVKDPKKKHTEID